MSLIKLNYYLHVLGRRTDGYHLLEHLCVPFAGLDRVVVTPSAQDGVFLDGVYAAHLKDLLQDQLSVVRALVAFRIQTKSAQSYAIHLTKNVPPASGLGAGSFNAAETLVQLHTHENLPPPSSDDYGHLGAEMPFCLYAKPALVQGNGERITPAENFSTFYPVIVWPNAGAQTTDVFAAFAVSPDYQTALENPLEFLRGKNGLEFAAKKICPSIAHALTALQKTQDFMCVRMTGSGSGCFGLYETASKAAAAEKTLRQTCPDSWWIYRP